MYFHQRWQTSVPPSLSNYFRLLSLYIQIVLLSHMKKNKIITDPMPLQSRLHSGQIGLCLFWYSPAMPGFACIKNAFLITLDLFKQVQITFRFYGTL